MLSTHESIPRRNFRVCWCCMQIFTRKICANSSLKDIQGKSQTWLPENGESIPMKMPPHLSAQRKRKVYVKEKVPSEIR